MYVFSAIEERIGILISTFRVLAKIVTCEQKKADDKIIEKGYNAILVFVRYCNDITEKSVIAYCCFYQCSSFYRLLYMDRWIALSWAQQ